MGAKALSFFFPFRGFYGGLPQKVNAPQRVFPSPSPPSCIFYAFTLPPLLHRFSALLPFNFGGGTFIKSCTFVSTSGALFFLGDQKSQTFFLYSLLQLSTRNPTPPSRSPFRLFPPCFFLILMVFILASSLVKPQPYSFLTAIHL